jgi:5-methylcytosine-specific restriction protein B
MKRKIWHLQMFQPYGRNNIKIKSIEMLQASKPIIGTGDWDDLQCYYFKNFNNEGIQNGDIIMVREGQKPIALCEVIDDEAFRDDLLKAKYYNVWYRYVKILDFYTGSSPFPQAMGTLEKLTERTTRSYRFIETWYNQIIFKLAVEEYTNIINYKKQIILQGPPGTGKTKLAKEIAADLIFGQNKGIKPTTITATQIIKILKGVDEIPTVEGNVVYKVLEVDQKNATVKLQKSTGSTGISKFSEITDLYKQGSFRDSITQNDKRRAAAIANYISNNIEMEENLESTNQFKMIQFHPSYTYEDFVRGIIAKPDEDGTGITYVSQDKVLAELANLALENYIDSQKPLDVTSREEWTRSRIREFQEYLETKIESEKVWLTPEVAYLTRITNDTIRYKGDKWKIDGGIPYGDIEKMYLADVATLAEIRALSTLTLSAKSNATYWKRILDLFKLYLNENLILKPNHIDGRKVELKNFVLIIDEINRANVASVLGELIYALEYRGQSVSSIYENDKGQYQLTLPPNLFIIGTMNTADRSVGHLDYAVRRRFAFIEVLPKELESNKEFNFDINLFRKVARLFTKDNGVARSEFISSDFSPNDVSLGHSYFIQTIKQDGSKVPASMNMRLKYEIQPILFEYVKDGVLLDTAIPIINNLSTEM